MKLYVHSLLFLSLFINSCSSEKNENGPKDPEGLVRNANGDVIKVLDSDCDDLANNLPVDVFGFVSEKVAPFL